MSTTTTQRYCVEAEVTDKATGEKVWKRMGPGKNPLPYVFDNETAAIYFTRLTCASMVTRVVPYRTWKEMNT